MITFAITWAAIGLARWVYSMLYIANPWYDGALITFFVAIVLGPFAWIG